LISPFCGVRGEGQNGEPGFATLLFATCRQLLSFLLFPLFPLAITCMFPARQNSGDFVCRKGKERLSTRNFPTFFFL
jgi:hypothetical protein